ncbi:MAG TPA: hypothetical protein PLM49_03725 [Bacteroidales bacterium]|nr:hypothetical protein [Bacteroidales bacterium]
MKQVVEYYRFIERTDDLIRRYPQRFLSQPNSKIIVSYPEIHKDMKRFYKLVFGISYEFGGCSSCFMDRYFELKNLKLTQIMNKMQLKSKLRDGVVVQIDGTYYSNESPHLTNEVCNKIYAKYGSTYFEHYEKVEPDNSVMDVPEKFTADDLEKFFEKEMPMNFDIQNGELVDGEPEAITQPDFGVMKITELREYAKRAGVELKSKKKAEIINELKK